MIAKVVPQPQSIRDGVGGNWAVAERQLYLTPSAQLQLSVRSRKTADAQLLAAETELFLSRLQTQHELQALQARNEFELIYNILTDPGASMTKQIWALQRIPEAMIVPVVETNFDKVPEPMSDDSHIATSTTYPNLSRLRELLRVYLKEPQHGRDFLFASWKKDNAEWFKYRSLSTEKLIVLHHLGCGNGEIAEADCIWRRTRNFDDWNPQIAKFYGFKLDLQHIKTALQGAELPFCLQFDSPSNPPSVEFSDEVSLKRTLLVGANLSGAKLRSADLRGAILVGADLSDATLCNADLQQCVAHGSNFARSNLIGANFLASQINDCYFQSSDLTGAVFGVGLCSSSDFSNAVATGASFGEAEMLNSNFSGAYLVGASFRSADLRGANFRSSNLDLATLHNARMSGVNLTGVRISGARFAGAILASHGELVAREFVLELPQIDRRKKIRILTDAIEFPEGAATKLGPFDAAMMQGITQEKVEYLRMSEESINSLEQSFRSRCAWAIWKNADEFRGFARDAGLLESLKPDLLNEALVTCFADQPIFEESKIPPAILDGVLLDDAAKATLQSAGVNLSDD